MTDIASQSQYGDDQAQYDAGSYIQQVGRPSTLSDDALYSYIKDNFLKDSAHSEEWREQAKKDDDFVAGEQWELDTYKRMVRDDKKQPITFNQTHKIIQLVSGLEINGRHQVVYLPRGLDEGEIVMNEDLNQASKWMSQRCKADDHQSAAFKDMLKTGMGWVEMRMDYEQDPQGMYIEEQVDPRDMYWDRSARKKNLSDAHRIYRVKKMRRADAREFAESLGATDVADEDLDAAWAIGVDQKAVKPREEIRLKQGPGNAIQEGVFSADPNEEVHLVQVQWWEREVYHRVKHPQTGQEVILKDHEHKQLLKAARQQKIQVVSARQTRKVYMQAFIGGRVLAKMPCPCPDRFTLQCMTGELYRSKGWWFGLVRLLRDPQMWTNKIYSQILHLLNTSAGSGIMAEKDAFDDIREAQRNWNKPGSIITLKPGGAQKVFPKPGQANVAPYVEMLNLTTPMLYQTTGINPELLAMNSNDQPGILEAQRKQSGMTILAPIFDARKTFLSEVGYIRLYFIQTFLADGRLVRVLGKQPGTYQAVRLMKDKVAGIYDVDVAEAPTSPDIKNQTWATFGQIAPFIQQHPNAGAALPLILEWSPLPSEASNKLIKVLSQPNPMMQAKEQLIAADAQSKIAHRQSQALQARAGAGRDQAQTINLIAQALFNVANAQHVDAQLREQQIANMLNGWMMSLGHAPDFSDQPFAAQPVGQGQTMQPPAPLPQPPTPPPPQAMSPQTLEAILAAATARQRMQPQMMH